jgi:sec-independent protein translocase protein TatB
LALIVVGPKDLPLMLRKIGRFMAKMRAMANEFRSGFDELARQAELDELKREVEALRRSNPLSEIAREVSHSLPGPPLPSTLPNEERARLEDEEPPLLAPAAPLSPAATLDDQRLGGTAPAAGRGGAGGGAL